MVLEFLIYLVGIVGNGLVFYAANRKPITGTLRNLNKVVRNLAVTEFLFNILAAPLVMGYWTITWNLGKN